jgi:dihydropteroate synthase
MFTLNCRGRLLTIEKPIVMGIINITPDSFYPGSRRQEISGILQQAESMLGAGATILDIGGQSTRPGSERIDEEEELKRVAGPVESICRQFPAAFVSIDTFYFRVAREAVEAGAGIVNDISAGGIDDKMIPNIGSLSVPYVLMHMKGTPQTMQQEANYQNVTTEVLDFFIRKKDQLQKAGIHDIIVDPGFGFAKTISHNFELLKNLGVLRMLERPLLLGVSRKSMVYRTLGIPVEQALNGTTVLHTIGLMQGAQILRTHDVKEAIEAIRLCRETGLV